MRSNSTIKNHQAETRIFKGRMIALIVIMSLLTLIIIIRLSYLQLAKYSFYQTLSQQNLLNTVPMTPKRGLIYDRNGVILADNKPSYSLDLIKQKAPHIEETLVRLQQILPITQKDVAQFNRSLDQYRPYQPIPIKTGLTEDEVAKFYVNRYRFPGVIINSQLTRTYPLGAITSDVLGYVGRINANDLNTINLSNYNGTNYIGKVGIEKYYEHLLHGNTGTQEVEIDAGGHVVRALNQNPPLSGASLTLTIDSNLQAVAQKALGSENGAVVAIDPSNGEILAMASNPTYDPNPFVDGISNKAYQKLISSPSQPLFNRPLRGQYATASTIKPFFALAGLENKYVTPQYQIFDPGSYHVPGTVRVYHDWHLQGHGWVNISKAIMVSCDTYFYNLAMRAGAHSMGNTMTAFGFGRKTGIDTTGELAGLVPSPEWKKAHKVQPWFSGDTVNMGIGQGFTLTTPLQLAEATATLAERGKHYQLHLVKKITYDDDSTKIIEPKLISKVTLHNPHYWNIVISAMQQVVKNPLGTGEHFGRNPAYTVAAKTGTAQVRGKQRNEIGTDLNIPKKFRNNHLFIAFAPVNHPKIAIVTVSEHSVMAAIAARKVLDYYLLTEHHLAKQHYAKK